jgi:hypothetical protein
LRTPEPGRALKARVHDASGQVRSNRRGIGGEPAELRIVSPLPLSAMRRGSVASNRFHKVSG